MDPARVQGFGQFNAQADIGSAVNDLAPLATVWHGNQTGVAAHFDGGATSTQSQGVLPAFWGKIESIGAQTGSILGGAATFLGKAAVSAVKAPYQFGEGISKAGQDYFTGNTLSTRSKNLSANLDSLMASYKAGRITGKEYTDALKQFSQDSTDLQKELSNFESSTSTNEKQFTIAAINTAADVASLATFGAPVAALSVAQTAALEAATQSANLLRGATVIGKIATDEAAWKAVNPIAQQAIKLATSKALEAAGQQVTAQQIARAAAVNLLIKYPLSYNYLSDTGQQMYQELDNNKYGDAIKTAAFNGALLLSGGVIGWGLKYANKAAKATSVAAGLRPGSMLDELSSRIGTGDRRALAQIAQDSIKNGNEADVKSMIVALESNLSRANGNTAQAVNFITDHLENYVGWGSLHDSTPQEVWNNLVNYWKHAEGLEKLKKAGQIEGILASDGRAVVPGRFTVQDKNAIAAAVSADGEAGWQAFKEANPNSAAANNVNLDKQITHIIKTTPEGAARSDAIRSIPAQFGLKGIPKEYADKMAKDGYIAIIPRSHNAPVVPFEETAGKLATNGAEGDFFVKAAKPVPVLRSVSSFLTWAGLSPEVASQRVGDVFRGNLVGQLDRVGYAGLQGDTKDQVAQDVLHKLSNYMKAPTVGRFVVNGRPVRTPIIDYRQLTTKDVMAAVGVSRSEAKQIQDAIMQSYIDVPRQISGLGNKILDYNFKFNPAAAAYSRIQGAARFAWNPMFQQVKLPIKAEILSQLHSGGKFPTVAGTNTFMKFFFPGKYKEIDGIVGNAQFRSLMPGGFLGEGADAVGVAIGSSKYNQNALRPVAGLVHSMAEKLGMTADDFIRQNPDKVADIASAVLHYDHNANFLNSPLTKTLNLAIFPFRFNVKVLTFMGKALAKQDPLVQYAFIKGTMDAHKYLNSPEGQAWYSQHADAIGLFKYVSPLETISVVSSALGLKHDSIAQYGELGGLPFGWIPQMLDSVGLTHFNEAYVNPKTGVIAKEYIPTSMYGAINAAMQDLFGSLFSYPGATAGLPSKGKIDRTIINGVLPGSGKDFKTEDPANISPQDQSFANTVQSMNPQASTGPVPSAPQFTGTNVPKGYSKLDVTNPNKKISAGKSSSGPKKKKSDYTPSLLPGQSSLGQL